MKKYVIAVLSVLYLAGAVFGAPDNNPVSAGGALPHNPPALKLDGAYGNPALVGTGLYPRYGLSLLPTSVAMWSDDLAPPLNSNLSKLIINPSNFKRSMALYLSSFFESSFGVNNKLTPEEVSDILTREMSGGVNFYVGAQSALFAYASRGFALTFKTSADIDMRISEGFLLPVFSATDGLVAGKVLDFSDFSINALWTSEAAVKLGFTISVPAISDNLKLDKGAAGMGFRLILGHGYFKSEINEGGAFTYDTVANKYKADATIEVTSVGTGLRGDFHFDKTYLADYPISGQGWGLDFGTVFHNNSHFLSVDIQDFGMIFWDGKQVYRNTFVFDQEFDLHDLSAKFNELFDFEPSRAANKSMITWLPAAVNAGYTYFYDLSRFDNISFLVGHLSAGANIRQQLILGPGKNTYIPRLGFGGSAGFLSSCLPVRYGLIVGGPEKLASSLGVGLDLKYISADFTYKAVGSPLLISEKGFEAAAALTFKWGFKPKRVQAPREEAPEPVVPEPLPPEPEPEPEPKPEPETPPLPELPEIPVEPEVVYPPIEVVLTMLEPAPRPTEEDTRKLSVSQRAINFRSGGADLTPSSFGALNEIANLLKNYPNIRYEIQGHTDSQGGDLQNLLLSTRRAQAVKNYLLSQGAPEGSLIAIGYGKNMPIADNGTVQGRAQNRRVEFVQILSQEHYDSLKKFEAEMLKYMTEQTFGGAR